MGKQTKYLQKLAYMVLNSKQNIMHHKSPLECCDVSHIGVCKARTPNAKTQQLPSTGTVTPPKKAQLCIRMNSINGTRKRCTPLLEFKNPNFEFEKGCRSVVEWKKGSTASCEMSRDIADCAVMIFRVINSNISSKFSTVHSNMSDFFAVVTKDGTGPNAIGHVMSRSLTVIAETRVRHGSGSVKSGEVLRNNGGR